MSVAGVKVQSVTRLALRAAASWLRLVKAIPNRESRRHLRGQLIARSRAVWRRLQTPQSGPRLRPALSMLTVHRRAFLLSLLLPIWASAGPSPLPVIGPAPTFALVDQAGHALSLGDLRGKVLAISFVFTTCSQSCPIVTAKMAEIQRRLGSDFGSRVHFVSISVDPLTDTPERLRAYAAKFGADVPGWSFLTGSSAQIDDVVRRFGGYARREANGPLDHLALTSLVDAQGRVRVQYLGYRFDVGEMLADLQALIGE